MSVTAELDDPPAKRREHHMQRLCALSMLVQRINARAPETSVIQVSALPMDHREKADRITAELNTPPAHRCKEHM